MRLDAARIECLVYVFKEGLLSPAAHDLKLRAHRLEADVDEAAGLLRARVDPASLQVECAMRGGVEAPEVLSDEERAEIRRRLQAEVLETARHPDLAFEAAIERTGERLVLVGRLRLHGQERPLTLHARREGGRWVAEAVLRQPDWGIRPYRALMGALKVKPEVRVRVTVADAGP